MSAEKKRVLYISNIEVPYRVRFFNDLARRCDLTVLYERKKSANRDAKWANSESGTYKTAYLGGIPIKNESAFSFKIFKYLFGRYDAIIVGCYNSPVETFAILCMKLFRIPYLLNVDGEVFVGKGVKSRLKTFFLTGAKAYLAAGEKAAQSVRTVVKNKPVVPYYFSSLSEAELAFHRESAQPREDFVLVVGQYFSYKGMDVALAAAKADGSISYKFVGMGTRTALFAEETGADRLDNVEIIPFLEKPALEELYRRCAMLVLPSRQECWGLVVNEAASFGTPIVSTWGSGAAVEFLADSYPQYLAKPDDPADLLEKIQALLATDSEGYGAFLRAKSKDYSIERTVACHVAAIDKE